jgi:hypothetical protein
MRYSPPARMPMASIPVIDAREPGGPGDFLTHGFSQLLRRAADVPVPFAPLVIVAADRTPASACLAAFLEAEARAVPLDHIAIWDGPTLGRTLATRGVDRLHEHLIRHRLVVIDHIDDVGGPDRQRAVVGLFDALHRSGTATCVSLSTHPSMARSLAHQLASRLSGGLLIVLPDAPRGAATAQPRSSQRPVTLTRIFTAVSRHEECSVADLCGPSRCRAIAAARSLALYVARVVTHKSFQAIGAACGGRDHTTVMHAVKVVTRRMTRDAAFATDVSRLVDRFAGPAPLAADRSLGVDSEADCLRRTNRHLRRRRGQRCQAPNRRHSGGR